MNKAMSWNELATEYDKHHAGRTARTLPFDVVFDWAERQEQFALQQNGTLRRNSMSEETKKYLSVSGRVDDMSPTYIQDLQKFDTPSYRPCTKKSCEGSMTFVNTMKLRPGREDSHPVDVYTCSVCKNSIMEKHKK